MPLVGNPLFQYVLNLEETPRVMLYLVRAKAPSYTHILIGHYFDWQIRSSFSRHWLLKDNQELQEKLQVNKVTFSMVSSVNWVSNAEMPRVVSIQFVSVAHCLLHSYLVLCSFFSVWLSRFILGAILFHLNKLFTFLHCCFCNKYKELEKCCLNIDNKYTLALDGTSLI